MQRLLLSNQSSQEVSVQHPLRFTPLPPSSLHPAASYPSAFIHLQYIHPFGPEKSEQLTSLAGSLSTQAENMIAGRPAEHEMSGGSTLLYNPLIFKLDWLVVEYGSRSDIMRSKYTQKIILFFLPVGWLKDNRHVKSKRILWIH